MLRGGPSNASVGMNLDCSSFVQYCYWAQGFPFAAGNTAAYGRTGDLRAISLPKFNRAICGSSMLLAVSKPCADGARRRRVDRMLLWLRRLRKHVQRMDGEPRLPLLYLCRILRRHFHEEFWRFCFLSRLL